MRRGTSSPNEASEIILRVLALSQPAFSPRADAASHSAGLEALLRFHLAQITTRHIGSGRDQYCDDILEHPAAVAFYARGLARLATATRDPADAQLAFACGRRLIELAKPGPLPSWGLAFDWREITDGSPDTFTTAVALLALAALNELDPTHRFALNELHGSARWLIEGVAWRDAADGSGPLYAPGWDYLATNVVGLTAAALLRAHAAVGATEFAERANAALRLVLGAQDPLGFWPYADPDAATEAERESGRVIDAVHSAYTIEGLLEGIRHPAAIDVPEAALRAAAQLGIDFLSAELIDREGWIRERVLVLRYDDRVRLRLLADPSVEPRPLPGGRTLMRLQEESRLQSYGACLALLQRAASLGLAAGRPLGVTLEHVLSSLAISPTGRFPYHPDDPQPFPRHESQLFDGLATVLAEGSSERAETPPEPRRAPSGRPRRVTPNLPADLQGVAGKAVAATLRDLIPSRVRLDRWTPPVEDRAAAACLFAELEARLPKSTGADAYATAERLARGIVTRGDPGPGPNLVAAAMPDRAAEAIDAGARKGATNDDFGRAARLRAVTAVTGYDAERSWWVRRLASDTTVDGDAPGWRALALAEAGTDVAGLMPALAAAAAELSERELAAAACATGGKEATVLMRELVGRAAAGETGIWGAWALTRLGADLTAAARIIRGRSQAKKE